MFHINKKGKAIECKNKECKRKHYATWADAQMAKEGKIPSVNKNALYKKAETKKDFDYINKRINFLKKENDGYAQRCKEVEKIEFYVKKHKFEENNKTEHFLKDRINRQNAIERKFGTCKSIGNFRVKHTVKGNLIEQIVEIKTTGQINIYDISNVSLVTTFISHSRRIETLLLMAGFIPSKSFLEEVALNRKKFQPCKK